jgi:hypothetical protein
VGTKRYKIGCSKKLSLDRCKNGYNAGTRYLCINQCSEPFIIEGLIKLKFNELYKCVSGNEYFEIFNELDALKIFMDMILEHSKRYITNNPNYINQNYINLNNITDNNSNINITNNSNDVITKNLNDVITNNTNNIITNNTNNTNNITTNITTCNDTIIFNTLSTNDKLKKIFCQGTNLDKIYEKDVINVLGKININLNIKDFFKIIKQFFIIKKKKV